MEIRVLRYFVEIAKEGNMTRAAKNLHVSQSALSKQMKELEDELGRPLFTRTKSGLSLTEAGALLHKRAEDILNMVDKTTDEFASLDTVRGGNIRIGCAALVNKTWTLKSKKLESE
ncbi:LysR family transcriptional regulator, partial [uncultured Megasphaera sp.]|uniref:LysR family transcriptional regulator n=1 Tax=uncultured Megasphaera sp. TaxID=165188 RepID=UPI0025954677